MFTGKQVLVVLFGPESRHLMLSTINTDRIVGRVIWFDLHDQPKYKLFESCESSAQASIYQKKCCVTMTWSFLPSCSFLSPLQTTPVWTGTIGKPCWLCENSIHTQWTLVGCFVIEQGEIRRGRNIRIL